MVEEAKIWGMRIAGLLSAILAIAASKYLFAEQSATLGYIAVGAVAWFVGKLTEKPLPIVTRHAARSVPPREARRLIRILSHRPPTAPVSIAWDPDEEQDTPVLRGKK